MPLVCRAPEWYNWKLPLEWVDPQHIAHGTQHTAHKYTSQHIKHTSIRHTAHSKAQSKWMLKDLLISCRHCLNLAPTHLSKAMSLAYTIKHIVPSCVQTALPEPYTSNKSIIMHVMCHLGLLVAVISVAVIVFPQVGQHEPDAVAAVGESNVTGSACGSNIARTADCNARGSLASASSTPGRTSGCRAFTMTIPSNLIMVLQSSIRFMCFSFWMPILFFPEFVFGQ